MYHNLIFSLKNKNFKNKKKNLLAGSWVLEKHKKNKLKKKNYDIFESKSFQKKIRIKNSIKANIIYQNIATDLAVKLNILHGVDLPIKSWKVIFGNWLRRFVNICYERNYVLNEILDSYKIKKIYGIKTNYSNLIYSDTEEIFEKSSDEYWNNNIFYELLKYYNYEKKFNFINISVSKKKKTAVFKQKNFFIKSILSFFSNIFFFLKNENYAVITNTYLPFIYEKLLEIFFFQIPNIYKENILYNSASNNTFRKKLFFKKNNKNNLENFIKQILPFFMPTIFLEDFKKIYDSCDKFYPKNPKFIITAISNEIDSYFKFFVAKKIKNKVPYFVIQHGNTFFTEDFVFNRVEYETTTKFFSFGCKKPFSETFFNPITFKRKIRHDKNGLVHLLPTPLKYRVFPYDISTEFNLLLENVKNFQSKIDTKIKNKILIRIDKNYLLSKRGLWFQDKYFKKFKKNQIDYFQNNYFDNLKKSRINIFFYDSSGILENLHYNLPTLAIWPNFFNHISDKFIKDYLLLKKSKILFDNLNDLINHLNNIWENVDDWWFSKNTQLNISKFNDKLNIKGDFKKFLNFRNKIKQIVNKFD